MSGLSARSVVASTLLGTVPPRLPGRVLVAFAAEFGITDGTTRTAMSRMVDRGELLRSEDGVYELTGELRRRHERQQSGLRPEPTAWDGSWELHIVSPGPRPAPERAALRRHMADLGLWEHRDGVWMRPANLPADRAPAARTIVAEQAVAFVARPEHHVTHLLADLVDLDTWAATARSVVERLEQEKDPGADLASGFLLAAEALRHLVTDPVLPAELAPDDWPAEQLRAAYTTYFGRYQADLSTFFRSVLRAS